MGENWNELMKYKSADFDVTDVWTSSIMEKEMDKSDIL